MARNGRGLRHVFSWADYRWLNGARRDELSTVVDGRPEPRTALSAWVVLTVLALALYLLSALVLAVPSLVVAGPQPGSPSPTRLSITTPASQLLAWIQVPGSQSGSSSSGHRPPATGSGKPDVRSGQGIDFDTLIELIKTTVAPETWDDAGGAGTIADFPGGVYVDAKGLLRFRQVDRRRVEPLRRLRTSAAKPSSASGDAGSRTPLRKVSLTRLERAVAKRLARGLPPTEEMRYLAGLTEVRHLFVYPETGDLVIAGPAEPWITAEGGAVAVGQDSGKPVVHLDDLVTLLRVASHQGPGVYACGIYPTREGLSRVQQYLDTHRLRSFSATARQRFVAGLKEALGPQEVRIWGVPATSRVAFVLVAADYHMKLVGIDLVDTSPELPSYLDLLRVPPSGRLPALQTLRWWFVPEYEAIVTTPEHDAFRLDGSGVRLLAENEFLTRTGHRVRTGSATLLNRQFARTFTEQFPKLAEEFLIYAELRNLFDLTTIASLIVNYELDRRVGWDHGVFAVAGSYEPARWNTPQWVDSVVNQRVLESRTIERGRRVRKRHLVTVVSGGVVVNPWPTVHRTAPLERSEAPRKETTPPADPDRWWWD